MQDTCTNCKNIKNSSIQKNIIKNVRITNTNFAKNKKCAEGVCNMKNLQYKVNTKSNSKKIFAIMFALWFLLVISISQLCITIFTQNTDAVPTGNHYYDIVIKTNELGLTDADFSTLKSAGWNDCESAAYYQSDFARYICKNVGFQTYDGNPSISTAQVDLPIAILENICGKVQMKATIGGVEKTYSNTNYTMSGYTPSDFSSGPYPKNTDDAYILFVDVVKLQTQNSLELTINFENIQYQGSSIPLYVFDNDTNEILSTTAVVQSATSAPIKIDFVDITTVRISLAVPYLWEIEWTNADSLVNKSAVVKVSGEVAISAKVKVINSYNNIIIV